MSQAVPLFPQNGQTSPYAARLLGNLLLHAPQLSQDAIQHDPELEFLMSCPEFGLVLCAVAYQSDHPRTLRQLAIQQDTAYRALADALTQSAQPHCCCIPAELENQFVALLIPKGAPVTADFSAYLSQVLAPCLHTLTADSHIPVYGVYATQQDLTRLSPSYTRMKNALVFLDYVQSGAGCLTRIGELEPRAHIGLWNQMEASSATFVDAFLRGDVGAASTEVEDMIAAITDWIPPSKDSLMTDIQYYFDTILNRFSAQFGAEVIQDISVADAIFETASLRQLRENLQRVVNALFQNVRKNTANSTFTQFLQVRDYIDEHIREYTLSAGGIAAAFSISPQLLSIQFKKCFGVTPIRYIEQCRVALIQETLLQTDLSIEKICQQVGMGSVSTLHRVFQKHCGMSPGVFRQMGRQH